MAYLPQYKFLKYRLKHIILLQRIAIYNIIMQNQVKWIPFNHFVIKILFVYKSYHINAL